MEWFTETLHRHWRQQIDVAKVLYHDKTEHQELILFESQKWGRVLALDGIVQTTTNDEFAYHEMLAHPAIVSHGRARRVCIVGGGDGGTAREVLKHQTIEQVVMAELDPGVIEFCKRYLPSLSAGAFDDPRLEIVFGDAARFMQRDGETFDLILVDSTDPIGPGAALFTEAFYRDCRRRLAEGGILVTQAGNPAMAPDELRDVMVRKRAAGFGDVDFLLTVVPTYIGGFMALGWASDDATRRRVRIDTLRSRPIPDGLRYYTPEVHQAAFAHPVWVDRVAGKIS